MKSNLFYICLFFIFGVSFNVQAHHYKGLPHYGYYENYPQIPVDEFLGQVGQYEFSLVLYDFQGIKKSSVEQPDDVRLYLIIYNLKQDTAYKGRVTLEILDKDRVLYKRNIESAEEESLYLLNQKLSEKGTYSLRITLLDEQNLQGNIPFVLSSQKINWARWIVAVLGLIIIIASVSSRKARVNRNRKSKNLSNLGLTHAR